MGIVFKRELGVPKTEPKTTRERNHKKEKEVSYQWKNQNPPVSYQNETDDGCPFIFFNDIHSANAVLEYGVKKMSEFEIRGQAAEEPSPGVSRLFHQPCLKFFSESVLVVFPVFAV